MILSKTELTTIQTSLASLELEDLAHIAWKLKWKALPRNYLLAQCVTEWQQYDGVDLRESHSKGVVAVQIELGTQHHQPVSQLSSLPKC